MELASSYLLIFLTLQAKQQTAHTNTSTNTSRTATRPMLPKKEYFKIGAQPDPASKKAQSALMAENQSEIRMPGAITNSVLM